MARVWLNKRSRLVNVKSCRKDLRILSAWVAENELKPSIVKVYGFQESPDAHRYIESKRTRSKIVLALEAI